MIRLNSTPSTSDNQATPERVVDCLHAQTCGGCDYIGLKYSSQIELKKNSLLQLLQDHHIPHPEIEFHSAGDSNLRDRLDFTLVDGKLGLFSKDSRRITDIEICQQLSPALQSWLQDFRKIKWPLSKASFRLRVNQYNERGLWIDAANIDIKNLLDEKNILSNLLEQCSIEMGQRRKRLALVDNQLKLTAPNSHPWFTTFYKDNPMDLFCQIASFTQPSLEANKLIAQLIASWVRLQKNPRILEFGSGIGNLTFPALGEAAHLTACEIDELALEGLQASLRQLPLAEQKKLTIHRGDFQKKILTDFKDFDMVLANPPRSGLQNFLNPLLHLESQDKPPYFIYMSCFPESFIHDSQRLIPAHYSMEKLCIVDQFPQTKHYEILALFKRNETPTLSRNK